MFGSYGKHYTLSAMIGCVAWVVAAALTTSGHGLQLSSVLFLAVGQPAARGYGGGDS